MSRLIKTLFVGMLFAMLCSFNSNAGQAAQFKPEDVPEVLVPRMSKPPVIDGIIGEEEWREASALSGTGVWIDMLLLPRPTTFYFAWDPDHFYFACRVYLRPGYKPNTWNGRSEGMAFVFDDGLELIFKPKGKNLVFDCAGAAYKLFLNNLGFKGDMTRLELGQQLKNWGPEFKVAARITEPGSAPNGGAWWELEMSSVPEDFNLKGKHQAGDEWRMMLGINHFGSPSFMQARIPSIGSYFESECQGYVKAILTDNMPAVKFTMDDLNNIAVTIRVAMNLKIINQARKSEKIDVAVNIGESLSTNVTINVPANDVAQIDLVKELPQDLTNGILKVAASAGDKVLLKYATLFERGHMAGMLDPVPPRDPTKFPFSANFNPVRGLLQIAGDTYYLATNDVPVSMHYVVSSEKGDKLAENTVTNIAEWFFREIISLPSVPPGRCTVVGVMKLADGRLLGPMTNYFEKKDEAKEFGHWWDRKDIGSVERVLPPFTAIKRQKGKGATYECWGREYTLNSLGLPYSLVSQSNALIASPARIVVVVDGKEQSIELGAPKITEEKDWRIRFEGKAEGAGLEFTATGWMEQDGLVYTEITYKPKGKEAVKVDSLRVEFPLADEEAECLLCIGPGNNFSSHTATVLPKKKRGKLWSTLVTGRPGSGLLVGSFYPTVWLGNERRGFLWWGDNDRGWFPENDIPAHSVERVAGNSYGSKSDVLVFRNNIIGKSVEINKAHTFAFGWNATPFKPLLQGWRNWAATEDGTFFQPFRGVRMDSKTGKKVKEGSGQKNWIHPESRYPEEWSALWAEQRTNSALGYESAEGRVKRLVPFEPYAARNGIFWGHMSFTLHGYGEKSLELDLYKYFKDEWYAGSETWNESFIDYCIYLFDRAFREGGVCSTYWDITFPILHNNLLGGLAYELPDGRIQKGYNGFNIRRFFQRLHAAAYDNGLLPGCNGAHSTHAYVTVAMPWLDAVLDGERNWNVDISDNDWVDYYPKERMRAMSVPHSWGLGICWMGNIDTTNRAKRVLVKTQQGEYVWLHDSWINPYVEPGPTRMPANALRWGMNAVNVEYIPYWRNDVVNSGDDKILVSVWNIPSEERIMFEVFNYGYKEKKDIKLKLDLKKLGLSGKKLFASDIYNAGCSNEPIVFNEKGGIVTINQLPHHRGRLVGVGVMDESVVKQLSARIPQWAPAELSKELMDYGMFRKETKVIEHNKLKTVSCTNENIEILMWQLPDRVVMFVQNNSEKGIQAEKINLDLKAVGITFKKWQTFVRAELFGVEQLDRKERVKIEPQLDYYNGILTVKSLPAKGGRIVGLRSY